MSGGRSVGYLFTDIDGSVAKWERSPYAMHRALARHDVLINGAVTRHGGVVADRAGDGVFAVFDGGNPLACALELQRAFRDEPWDDVGGLAIRIGVHAATEPTAGERNRQAVNRANRMALAAWGGQTVVSALAAALFGSPPGARLTDLGSVYLRSIPEPQRLFSLTSADMSLEEFPPLRSVTRQSPSLPSQTTPIFGRKQHLGEVLELIDQGRRWITITGAGGIGKTRLSLEVASSVAGEREVHLVMLSPGRRDAREFVLAIVAALRLPRRAGANDIDLVSEYLGDKDVLLVIDNADGIDDGEEVISKILATTKGVSVLATSREPFMSAAEKVYKLAGLDTPTAENFRDAPAGKLFEQSAQAVDQTFAFTDADAAYFPAICEAVRGSPLALHLTAQWVSVLSLKEIAENLGSGAGLLSKLESGGLRTFRDVFNGSWALLTDEQRAALSGLAVFPGTFDAQAAKAIADVSPATLQALERKSLLERRSSYRFALHPLIYEFAAERLEADPSRANAAQRHSDYYLSRIDEYFAAALTADQPKVAERMRAEFASMTAAWAFASARRRGDPSLLALAERTFYLYVFGAMYSEALDIFSGVPADHDLRAIFLALRANCLIHLAHYDEAASLARQVLTLAAPDDDRACGHAHHALGNVAHARSDWESAEQEYQFALELRADDTLNEFYSSMCFAFMYVPRKQYALGQMWLQRGQVLNAQLDYVGGAMILRTCEGALAAMIGDTAQALAAYQAAISMEPLIDNGQNSAALRCKIAELEMRGGDTAGADRTLAEAYQLASAVGDVRNVMRALTGLGSMARTDPAKARGFFMEALRIGRDRQVGDQQMSVVLIACAHVEAGDGRLARAAHLIAIVRAFGAPISPDDLDKLRARGVDVETRITQLSAHEAIDLLLEEYKGVAR